MSTKRIDLEAGHTQTDVEDGQFDYVQECDTIREAKRRAKYVLSDDYQRAAEMSEPLRYARIMVDGECLYDFFAKGYNGEEEAERCHERLEDPGTSNTIYKSYEILECRISQVAKPHTGSGAPKPLK